MNSFYDDVIVVMFIFRDVQQVVFEEVFENIDRVNIFFISIGVILVIVVIIFLFVIVVFIVCGIKQSIDDVVCLFKDIV